MQSLIVDDFGAYLGKRSERVSVRYRDKEREKEEHALDGPRPHRHRLTRCQYILRSHRRLKF